VTPPSASIAAVALKGVRRGFTWAADSDTRREAPMSTSTSDDTRTRRTALSVEGMTCGSCARTVERALAGAPGAERAAVDLGRGRAFVEGSARPEDLAAAVEAAGYTARLLPQGEAEWPDLPADERRRGGGCCG
jgi:Cu+-exporting ATPase